MATHAHTDWKGLPRRHPIWTAALALFVLLVVVLGFFNWNWMKGPVERMVSAATGREFRIEGDLDVDFFPLEVTAGGLYLGNAQWSSEPAMARVEHLHMRLRFWPLLVGKMTLPELNVDRPTLRLERNAAGLGNWMFSDEPRTCPEQGCRSRTRILQLHVDDGRLQFLEPTFETAVDVRFNSGEPTSEDALAPLILKGTGTYRAEPFELDGRVDSPLALQDANLPYRLDLTASAGDSRARVSGTLAEPLQIEQVNVNFELKGADLADLYEFTGIVLPTTPPYALKGQLSRNGNRFAYEKFTGTVGDSDLSGDARFDLGGPRPKLTAKLTSKLIDFDDLAGFIGGTPSTAEGETTSARQNSEAGKQRATGRKLPATPLNLGRLRAMDADVTLSAARVDSPRLPLETMQAHLVLDDGVLTLAPLNFGAAGGQLASTVKLDAREEPARFGVVMQVDKLQLPKLMPKVKQMEDSLGTLSGAIDLTGEGNSAATIMATADGQMSVIMGRGRMSNLMLELAGLDIAEGLAFLIGKDRQVTLRCAYADFAVTEGVATARSVAFDTTDTALLLRGDMNFRNEALDFTLVPKPKDPSPISIRTPIRITGTFAQPAIGVKGEPLVVRGAAVAALMAIAPPLGLLGLIETGPGKDLPTCGPPEPDRNSDEPLVVPGPRAPPGALPPQPKDKKSEKKREGTALTPS